MYTEQYFEWRRNQPFLTFQLPGINLHQLDQRRTYEYGSDKKKEENTEEMLQVDKPIKERNGWKFRNRCYKGQAMATTATICRSNALCLEHVARLPKFKSLGHFLIHQITPDTH